MITAEMIKRRLIFDCMADPQKVGVLTGLVGVSEEGAEKEEEASLLRLGAVAPVFSYLAEIAEWMSEAAVALHVEQIPPDEVPPEFLEHFQAMLFMSIQGSLVAAFSVLNDLGMISINVEE